MNLFAQAAFGADAEAVAHDQHADHELRINRRPAGMAVVRREMFAKSAEIEVPINAAQEVRARNVIIKVERVEESVLHATLTTHHKKHSSRLMNQS
jgi:hypothetical protein